MSQQIQFFEQSKMTLPEAIDESLASLREYGSRFPNWVITFSGGKDSTAVVALVLWAIETGQIQRPETLTVLMSNTRIELVPLIEGAKKLLTEAAQRGFDTKVVEPELDDRVFVSILGRGLPPPNNGRRGCTRMLKVDPMNKAVGNFDPETTLFLTGIRLGESRSRDDRIAVSCSSDSGECGQGWFQNEFNSSGFASLSPIVHWRVCNVFDWLYFEQDKHGFDVSGVLEVYGDDDIRTGCMACFAVQQDKPLVKVSRRSEWAHLAPILELKDIYAWLERWENRLQMPLKYNKSGTPNKKVGTVGPLTMEARKRGLEMVLDIQRRSGVELISTEELERIKWHWEQNTWPRGWTGDEPIATTFQPEISVIGTGGLIVQPVLRNLTKQLVAND